MSKLIPRVFLIEQDVNEHVYFIQRLNLHGSFRWYIVLKINDPLPWTDKWRDGFDSPEDALEAWQKHYESTP